MVITDEMRLRLANKAREVFQEEGDVLMAHLPIGGIETLVSKQDLQSTKSELEKDLLKLETRIVEKIGQQTLITIGAITGIIAAICGVAGVINGIMN